MSNQEITDTLNPKKNILVVLENNSLGLDKTSVNILSAAAEYANILSAEVNVEIDVAICNPNTVALNEAKRLPNIRKIITFSSGAVEYLCAENLAPWLAGISAGYGVILGGASVWGRDLLPRLGALLDIQPITDVVKLVNATTFKRPIYAGSALQIVASNQPLKLISVRPSAFPAAALSAEENPHLLLDVLDPPAIALAQFINESLNQTQQNDLGSAAVVVAGGRGLQSAEKFTLVHELAECLNAAVGASRAAVDAGFASNDMQVGQTGRVVAPDLYIAVGISGAVQHLAGMQNSKVIVAINKDPDAPIFQIADYGLVGDLFELVPQIISALRLMRE